MTVGLWIGGQDGSDFSDGSRISSNSRHSLPSEDALNAALTWTDATAVPGRVEGISSRSSVSYPSAASTLSDSSRSRVQAIICAEGTPWPCEWALAVVYGGSAHCPFGESGGDPLAWATEIVDGTRYWFHGIWQIVSTSPDPGPLADPVYNTERAAEKYINEGTGAWPGCP